MAKDKPKKGDASILYDPKKDRQDRAALNQTIFNSLNINIETAETVILLLKSSEDNVILEAFHHLDKFAEKSMDNYLILYQCNILECIFSHSYHQNLFIRRYALKMLSQFFSLTEIKQLLIDNLECFNISVDTFKKIDDVFLQEFSSVILNHLCENDQFLKAMSKNSELVLSICDRIETATDPDVLVQSLEIFLKLSKNYLKIICSSDCIPFEAILLASINEYPKIQNASLGILIEIASCEANIKCREFFKRQEFMEQIFIILENQLWHDLHIDAIEIFSRIVQYSDIGEIFYKENHFDRYLEYTKNAENSLKQLSMKVFVELAIWPECHPILFENKIHTLLLKFLKENGNANIALGISRMAVDSSSLEYFLEQKTIETLFHSLNDDQKSWEDRVEFGRAMNTLFKLSQQACNDAIFCDGQNVINNIFVTTLQDSSANYEIDFVLTTMLLQLAKYSNVRSQIMNNSITEHLINKMKSSVKCAVMFAEILKCLRMYIDEPIVLEKLIEMDVASIIVNCLSDCFDESLKSIIANFIIVSCRYNDICDQFIDNGVLDCLLTDKKAQKECPNWSQAIEKTFSHNLPVKFAVQNRLDLNDVTEEMFYASKITFENNNCHILRNIFFNECSPKWPIVLCNFEHLTSISADEILENRKMSGQLSIKSNCYNRKPCDTILPEYLQTLKETLEIKKLNINKIETLSISDTIKIIQILSDMVCMKICSKLSCQCIGYDGSSHTISEKECNDLEIESCSCFDDLDILIDKHLKELKENLQSNIIPLGHIKIGGHFEKSLLFKILADRIGLPCGIEICHFRHITWNEVSIPLFDTNKKCGNLIPPRDLYQPTHIVDLMEHPGNVYAIGCPSAENYLKIND